MDLPASAVNDFELLSAKLSGIIPELPAEETVENFHRLLLLGRDELPDDPDVAQVVNRNSLQPVTEITKGITRACRRVCKITNHGGPSTGTLIGPDLVLAARHDFHGVGDFPAPADLTVVFDEFRFSDDTIHELKCPVARTADGKLLVAAKSEELDYVIFHLQSPIGLSPLGSSVRRRRGWMDLSTVNVAPAGNVIILQHPEGSLMKVADGVIKADTTGLQPGHVHYDTETKAGSSGGPVLNHVRQLVGMHVKQVNKIEELISLKAIFDDLKQKHIRLPRYPPPKAFTNQFLTMVLAPQPDLAFT